MKKLNFFYSCALIFIFLTGCATFPAVESGGVKIKGKNAEVDVAFSSRDRRIIHDYYINRHVNKHGKKKGMPPVMVKKETLPHGLQKKIEKSGKHPPGLAKKLLPADLEKKLSTLPQGYVRVRVSGDIVLLHEPTQVVIDIIYDV